MLLKETIYGLFNKAIKFTPKNVRKWWRIRKQLRIDQKKVKDGNTLVPIDELRKKQVEFLNVLKENNKEGIGDYLEFGVFNGTSLACMFHSLEEVGFTDTRLFGFDSFAGLPATAADDDDHNWYPGQYRMNLGFAKRYLTKQKIDWKRVVLVKGWFKDTLNEKTIKKYKIKKASVIMVDCDMYISAKLALDFCSSLIENEAVIIFDDWHSDNLDEKNLGEKKAFEEFLNENPKYNSDALGGYNDNSRAFHVYIPKKNTA